MAKSMKLKAGYQSSKDKTQRAKIAFAYIRIKQLLPAINSIYRIGQKMTFHRIFYSTFVLVLGFQLNVSATEKDAINQIETANEVFAEKYIKEHYQTKQRVKIRFNKLDPRLKLPLCSSPPRVELINSNTQSLTLKTSCSKPFWKIHRIAKLNVFQEVITANTSIPRGATISQSQLLLIEKDITQLHRGYFVDANQIIGSSTKYTIRPGTVINPIQLKTAYLIKKNQNVVIVAKSPNFSVKSKGVALNNGQLNDIIKVKNLNSNRIIQGKVQASGVVAVTL